MVQAGARPVGWRSLGTAQRDVFAEVVFRLQALVANLRDTADLSQKPRLPEALDTRRSNQVVFIDGGRGGGKTSILLSLMHAIGDYDGWEGLDRRRARAANESGQVDELQVQVREALRNDLRNRVVWLRTLDMEPLPQPTNLLAAIITRIDDAAKRLLSREARRAGDDENVSTDVLFDPRHASPFQQLADLQHVVALAWDGNLKGHGSALDPQTYAAEIVHAEHARLHLDRRLAAVLDRLAECNWRSGISNPLFVLPVDDFDLNPRRCLELLHLMRLVSNPRLVLLVAGDSEIAEQMFRLKILGDLSKSSGSANVGSHEPEATLADNVSSYALRKLIPPAHRVSLRPMTVSETLAFAPTASAVDHENVTQTMRELLALCPVRIKTAKAEDDNTVAKIAGRRVESLLDFLTLESPKVPAPRWAGRARLVYSGCALLNCAPREVHDLWLRLRNIVPDRPIESGDQDPAIEATERAELAKEAVGVFAETYREAVSEERGLNRDERRAFRDAVRTDYRGDWELHTNGMTFDASLDAGSLLGGHLPGSSILAYRAKDWDFRPKTQDEDGQSVKAPDWRCLSDRTTAALMILHDLLALRSPGGIAGDYLVPRAESRVWAAGRWDHGRGNSLVCPWPTPPWPSFWELCILRATWDRALLILRSPGMRNTSARVRRTYLAFVWLSACTAIVSGERTSILDLSGSEDTGEEMSSSQRINAEAEFARGIGECLYRKPSKRADARMLGKAWSDLWESLCVLASDHGRKVRAGTAKGPAHPEHTSAGTVHGAMVRTWLNQVAQLLLPECGLSSEISEALLAYDLKRKFKVKGSSTYALNQRGPLAAHWVSNVDGKHIRRTRAEHYARFASEREGGRGVALFATREGMPPADDSTEDDRPTWSEDSKELEDQCRSEVGRIWKEIRSSIEGATRPVLSDYRPSKADGEIRARVLSHPLANLTWGFKGRDGKFGVKRAKLFLDFEELREPIRHPRKRLRQQVPDLDIPETAPLGSDA